MSKQTGIVWISKETLTAMVKEAEHKLPNETGGIILGYWNQQHSEAVITRTTGPGPNAVHNL